MKVEDMSDKVKEKHAEFLLKFSSNLFTAFFVTVVMSPLSVISSQIADPGTLPSLSLEN